VPWSRRDLRELFCCAITPLDVRRWLEEKPSPDDYLGLEAVLRKTAKLYPQTPSKAEAVGIQVLAV
jgi:hypothetical protein